MKRKVGDLPLFLFGGASSVDCEDCFDYDDEHGQKEFGRKFIVRVKFVVALPTQALLIFESFR